MVEFIIQTCTLLIIGLIIGEERRFMHKVIGPRSTILILLGAFLYAYMSAKIGGDPTRIVGQICCGVGFIGAGIIWKSNNTIKNLTTAILVWTLSAIGCLMAFQFYLEVIIITIITWFILTREYKD